MTWGPHDLRLAKALGEQRLEAARGAGINLKHRPWRRRPLPGESRHHGLVLRWPIHLHRAAHGAAGHR